MSLDWIRVPANHKNEEGILALRAECGWEGYGIYLALLQAALGSANLCLTSDERLLSLCLAVDERSLNACLAVLERVQLVRRDGAKLFCTEVESAADQARKRSEQSREAGKASAEKRSAKTKPTNKRSTVAQRSLNASQPIRLDKTRLDNTKEEDPPLPPKGQTLPEPLEEFVRFRRELKKPLTPSSIRQLHKQHDADPRRFVESVRFTIAQGWQGLRHPSEVSNGRHPPPRLTPAQEMLKLAAELEEKNL